MVGKKEPSKDNNNNINKTIPCFVFMKSGKQPSYWNILCYGEGVQNKGIFWGDEYNPYPAMFSCEFFIISLVGLLEIPSKYISHSFCVWTAITSSSGRLVTNGQSSGMNELPRY